MFFWILDPKNYIADFVVFKAVYFGRTFCPKRGERGGGVIANPKSSIANLRILTNFLEKAQCNFQKQGGRGGRSRPFGLFSRKHPFLGRRSSLIWAMPKSKRLFSADIFPRVRIDFKIQIYLFTSDSKIPAIVSWCFAAMVNRPMSV